MRVYVPASRALLGSWLSAGAVPAAGPADLAERCLAAEDDEESEYAALMTAAADSRRLGEERRLVVVAELPGDDADAAFGVDRVVAVHADERSGARDDDDLAWFAPGELGTLLS